MRTIGQIKMAHAEIGQSIEALQSKITRMIEPIQHDIRMLQNQRDCLEQEYIKAAATPVGTLVLRNGRLYYVQDITTIRPALAILGVRYMLRRITLDGRPANIGSYGVVQEDRCYLSGEPIIVAPEDHPQVKRYRRRQLQQRLEGKG